jgi:hypothetical protein
MSQVYSVFDFDNNQVGFGSKTAANGGSGALSVAQTLVASSDGGEAAFKLARRTLLYGLGAMLLSMILLF